MFMNDFAKIRGITKRLRLSTKKILFFIKVI
jgi:hypothetical protein